MPNDHKLAMHRTTAAWFIGDAKDHRRRKSSRKARRQFARAVRRHNKALAQEE